MKILYKPFSILFALIGARVGTSVFKTLWGRVDQAEPPKPTTAEAGLGKVAGAAALEAATMATAGAVADRAAARTFHHLTGVWPGDQEQEKKDKKTKKDKKEAKAKKARG